MVFGAKCLCSKGEDDVIDTPQGEQTDQSVAQQQEEEMPSPTTESVYYDAMQSISEILDYPPATTSITAGATHDIDGPESALLVSKAPRRDSAFVKRMLQKKQKSPRRGYPGELTKSEFNACLEFRKKVKEYKEKGEPSYHEMLYCYEGVEEEAFALCRYLRARNFDVSNSLHMMEENFAGWKKARQHDFYPDMEKELGVPVNIFCTQFQSFYYGVAKNGSVVNYFLPGRINLHGIDCLTPVENLEQLLWHDCVYERKQCMKDTQETYPDTYVRFEEVLIIDLKGMHSDLLNERVMKALKEGSAGLRFSPEILNNIIVVNAPGFFSFSWALMKEFIDPRTVKKVGIFSREAKATQRLLEMIDKDKLPSDYGGTGPNMNELIEQKINEIGGTSRYVVETLACKRGGKEKLLFSLTQSETAKIHIFTRSPPGARASLVKDQDEIITHVDIRSETNKEGEPFSVELASDVKGPGRFDVLIDNSAGSAQHHFLVAVQVLGVPRPRVDKD